MKLVMRGGKIVRLETLPVTTCEGCGACCRHMGTPPGYAAYYPIDGEIDEMWKQSPDYQRWLNLPPEVEAALREYYDGVKGGTMFDRTNDFASAGEVLDAIKGGRLFVAQSLVNKMAKQIPIPCLWYDEEGKRCRHYEHRPEVCRDAIAPGDDACLATRKQFRIPLPLADQQ